MNVRRRRARRSGRIEFVEAGVDVQREQGERICELPLRFCQISDNGSSATVALTSDVGRIVRDVPAL